MGSSEPKSIDDSLRSLLEKINEEYPVLRKYCCPVSNGGWGAFYSCERLTISDLDDHFAPNEIMERRKCALCGCNGNYKSPVIGKGRFPKGRKISESSVLQSDELSPILICKMNLDESPPSYYPVAIELHCLRCALINDSNAFAQASISWSGEGVKSLLRHYCSIVKGKSNDDDNAREFQRFINLKYSMGIIVKNLSFEYEARDISSMDELCPTKAKTPSSSRSGRGRHSSSVESAKNPKKKKV